MSATESTSDKRPIRSFVIRHGRMTDGQEKAIDRYWSDYVIAWQPELLSMESVFPEQQDLVVEIGFGMGDSLLETAIANPGINYIGIEVHRPGVGKLLQGIAAADISNLRIICHDAKEVITHCFADNSLRGVQIFFPDPWHKKRHHKRRLVQAEFVSLLSQKLQAGGFLHLATDWQEYATQMLEVLNDCPVLKNLDPGAGYMQTTDRPETKFERRGKKLGHGVWDLRFEKRR
jgi:tRNA (guanine-N7-)-methyltransferase